MDVPVPLACPPNLPLRADKLGLGKLSDLFATQAVQRDFVMETGTAFVVAAVTQH